jgi:hypothetical protein
MGVGQETILNQQIVIPTIAMASVQRVVSINLMMLSLLDQSLSRSLLRLLLFIMFRILSLRVLLESTGCMEAH